jgi:hypothetical protein
MTLKKQLETTLTGIGATAAPRSLSLTDGGRILTCELAALDTLACSFTRLTLAVDRLAGASEDALRKMANDLTKRVNYLLEPIAPIEVDPEQCVIQLRSNPPQRDEHRSSYYELLVRRGGEISLCRYTKDRGAPRQVAPANVTREVLLRLVGDFEAAAP